MQGSEVYYVVSGNDTALNAGDDVVRDKRDLVGNLRAVQKSVQLKEVVSKQVPCVLAVDY